MLWGYTINFREKWLILETRNGLIHIPCLSQPEEALPVGNGWEDQRLNTGCRAGVRHSVPAHVTTSWFMAALGSLWNTKARQRHMNLYSWGYTSTTALAHIQNAANSGKRSCKIFHQFPKRLKKLWFTAVIDGLGRSLVLGMTCELWVREQCKPHQIWLLWTKKEEKLSTSKLTNRGQIVNVLSKECMGCCSKLWVKWEVAERGSDINLHLRAAWSAWNRTWFLHSHSQGTMK